MGVAVKVSNRRWPGRTIPYELQPGMNGGIQDRILKAFLHWETESLYRFVPKQADDIAWIKFVQINKGQHCLPTGRKGNEENPAATVISLSVTSSRGNAIHEIGHALGLAHEQNRINRSRTVEIKYDKIKAGKASQFKEVKGSEFENVGGHDYGSIMHYSRYAFAKPKRDDWTSGWTDATFYQAGGQTFGLFLKQAEGKVHISKVDEDGRITETIKELAWGAGWTKVQAFESGGKPYLFAFKGDRTARVFEIHASGANKGKLGGKTTDQRLTNDWTDFGFFAGAGKTFLFMLKSDDGKNLVHEITGGVLGGETDRDTWSPGWSTAVTYEAGGSWYLFALRGGSGEVDIHRLLPTGKVDRGLVEDHYWTAGWTDARFFFSRGKTYLILIKTTTGEVHIHEINGTDGSVGAEVERHDWSKGWTTMETYSADGSHYLFLLKASDGTVHVHEVDDGEVGDEVDSITIVTKDESKQYTIGQRRGLSSWDVMTASTRALGNASVSRMNPGGTVGQPIDVRLWDSGWTHAIPFSTATGSFLFFLKSETGAVDIHSIERGRPPGANFWDPKPIAKGEIGTLVKHYEWGAGWTSACFYRAGGATYLFMIKEEDGIAVIKKFGDDGKVTDDEVESYDWSDDWSDALSFVTHGEPYLLLYKEDGGREEKGRISINHLTSGGIVGKEVYKASGWTTGWTTVTTYEVNGQVYLFLLKAGDGDVSISHILKGGLLGKEPHRFKTWGAGWTHALPMQVGGKPYLLRLKSGDGTVRIHELESDGAVGDRVYKAKWGFGPWTSLASYEVGGETLLLTLMDEALEYE